VTSRVAADVGGTFTDIVVVDELGQIHIEKVPSTPAAFEEAVIDGVRLATAWCGGLGQAEQLLHGTTVATNAVLERSGPRTGLVTTMGFRDVLEIGRLRTPTLYDLSWSKPAPLVARRHRLEVDERLDAVGSVVRPLDLDGLAEAADEAVADGVASFAVCLLNAYVDSSHEHQVADWLRHRYPDVDVTEATEVVREIGEYERTSTAVLNAYLRPVVSDYLGRLGEGLELDGFRGGFLVMQSSGGMMTAAEASRFPVHILESGPAAGVLAAAQVAEATREAAVISFDMGGTTAKASLIEDFGFQRGVEFSVGSEISTTSRLLKGGGYAVRLPVVDLAEIGAGGGSIARVDGGGGLVVGPISAGADPGPACYGRGGEAATVTDANLVLGYLSAERLIAAGVGADRDLAERAIFDQVGQPLGLGVQDAAYAVHAVANRQMARVLRAVSTERGRHVERHTLIAFGGSGPLHAVSLAEAVGIPRVIVPPHAGVLSAVGLLWAPMELTAVEPVHLPLELSAIGDVAEANSRTAASLIGRLVDAGVDSDTIEITVQADVRYVGQASELSLATEQHIDAAGLGRLAAEFHRAHESTYGHGLSGPAEVVRIRVTASVKQPVGSIGALSIPQIEKHSRLAFFDGRAITTPIIGRSDLELPRDGPLLVDEGDTTTVVPPSWTAVCDGGANIVLERAS